ncbi:MAG: S-layer homology domain-containing protein [Cyanobacteria bacterium P01_A01_bin.84]
MENKKFFATVYVNPSRGDDNNNGSRLAPFRSLTQALKIIKSSAVIQLASGTYQKASGEVFPLIVPNGVIVVGNEATKGRGIVISGSGSYNSRRFGKQNITILLLEDAKVIGVTITNPQPKSSGVWIESSAPILSNNTFSGCTREGIFICGSAKPAISDNLFVKNGAGGILLAGNSKGEILRNIFLKNDLGIVASDDAAPVIANNKFENNRIAIALSRRAKPVLRHNLIVHSGLGGLIVNGKAQPDLGKQEDPAGNVFQKNGKFALKNTTSLTLVSAGNQLNPSSVYGSIDFKAVTEDITRQILFSSNFPDVGGHWAAAFIEALLKKQIIRGFPDGTFKPEAPITRAAFAAIIAKTFFLSTPKKIVQFNDIKANFWAEAAIYKAANMGFMSGFPDGSFRPGQNLTKIHAILALTNGLKLTGGNPSTLNIYRDRAQIPTYATNTIATATQKLLVVNYPQATVLEPLRNITRAEVAAIIHQALVARGKEKPIVSPYIVNPDTSVPSFNDLKGHWAEEFIRGLVSMGLTSGMNDGTYKPDKPMNRAEYASLIAAAFKPSPKYTMPTFTDINEQFWAYRPIQIAASSGFVGGFSDRTFRPYNNVQRLQVLVSLVNGLSLTTTAETELSTAFTDINAVPNYAHQTVVTAIQQKIVINYPDPKQLHPYQEATRGEVAAMLYQSLVAIGRMPEISSSYIFVNPEK